MAVKLSNASSTDSLLANDEFEMEKDQQHTSESPNHHDSDDTHNSVLVTTSQRTKPRFSIPSIRCTGERVMIAVMFVLFAAVVIALGVYVGELHRKVDRLESQRSSVPLNKIHLNSSSGLDSDDLSEVSHVSTELEKVKDRISIFENLLTQFNSTLSSSLLFFTNVDETASNNISALQRSVGLLEGDLGVTQTQLQNISLMYLNLLSDYDTTVHDIYTIRATIEVESNHSSILKTQLQNLSSLYTNLLSDYNATVHDIYIIRAAIEQNMSQLQDIIHQVESNHSLNFIELFRILDEAAVNRSILTHMIEDTLNLVASQGQTISEIRSNVSTMIESSFAGLRGILTEKLHHLDDRVELIQRNLSAQWKRLDNFKDQLWQMELSELLRPNSGEAIRVIRLGLLLILNAISFLARYI